MRSINYTTMPASTTLSPDDKLKVKKAVPKSSNKIITAAVARIYHAPPGADDWTYAEQEGALVFCADKASGKAGLWFRMVDLTVSIHSIIADTRVEVSCGNTSCLLKSNTIKRNHSFTLGRAM